jgi:hypothetical protein
MKTNFSLRALLGITLSLALLTGCKKNEEAPGLSAKIQSIVPDAVLTDLKTKGLVINEGATPPNVEGVFKASPYKLLAPYGPEDNYKKDRVINDYSFKFSGQNADDVKLDFKQTGASTLEGSGITSFLAGSGNKFTLFGEITGKSLGVGYKQLAVLSGEITPTGIKDFQYAFVFTSKDGDTSNSILIPVGKSRVWIDGDGLADKAGTFRLAAEAETGTPGRSAGSAQ